MLAPFRGHFLSALLSALVAVGVMASACGSSERGFGGTSSGGPGSSGDLGGGPAVTTDDALTVEPAETLLEVGDGKPPTSASLRAFIVKKDGTKLDVTAAPKFYVDDPPGALYASFAGPTFTPGPTGVGRMVVHAKYQSLLGDAVMKLHLTKTVVVAGAPADAPTKWGGPVDALRKPTIVYPADGVMVPPNTNELEWQFEPGPGNDLMWMSFASRRACGLRQEAGKAAQIWMAAFDPEAVAQGKDGSFPVFRLPFQELGGGITSRSGSRASRARAARTRRCARAARFAKTGRAYPTSSEVSVHPRFAPAFASDQSARIRTLSKRNAAGTEVASTGHAP